MIAPSFPFGKRADANVAFRACACCAGNPDMPLRGCGPGPDWLYNKSVKYAKRSSDENSAEVL